VTLEGPDVMLTPDAANTVGMVLYELSTNAAKYGALREAGGKVAITWRVNADAEGTALHLEWSETTAAPVAAALTGGFGTDFMRRSVEYELQGSVSLDLRREGLHCTIEFPLRSEDES
jgi:two-component system CheB/CheR fusion protein